MRIRLAPRIPERVLQTEKMSHCAVRIVLSRHKMINSFDTIRTIREDLRLGEWRSRSAQLEFCHLASYKIECWIPAGHRVVLWWRSYLIYSTHVSPYNLRAKPASASAGMSINAMTLCYIKLTCCLSATSVTVRIVLTTRIKMVETRFSWL